ncbi:MAG: winged helix-turn-helix transcriptional regulator [Muribaculum sp.]|nr:winged helix-turn-helix transcriptional regulator [Muribaculum sp.]
MKMHRSLCRPENIGNADTNRPETDQKPDQTGTNRAKVDQKTDQFDTKPIRTGQKANQKNQIIEILKKRPTVSRADLAEALGLHQSSVKRRLEALVKENRIKRVGPDNGGLWEVIE